MRTHWRHLANTIELMLPSAYPSPQPKRQIDRFSHFAQLTAESIIPILYNGRPTPHIAPSIGDLEPHLTRFLGPIRAHNRNGTSIGSAVLAQMTAECSYALQRFAPFPSKLLLPMGDLDPRLIQGSLSPPESSIQTASRSLHSFLQGSPV